MPKITCAAQFGLIARSRAEPAQIDVQSHEPLRRIASRPYRLAHAQDGSDNTIGPDRAIADLVRLSALNMFSKFCQSRLAISRVDGVEPVAFCKDTTGIGR